MRCPWFCTKLELVARRKWIPCSIHTRASLCGPADRHRSVELPEGCSLGWEGAVATASKVLAMGTAIPAEGKLPWRLSVSSPWSGSGHIPCGCCLLCYVTVFCCGHTSLPDLLGVKSSSLPFCQGNAFPRDVLGQDPWEAQCIQALSGWMEP